MQYSYDGIRSIHVNIKYIIDEKFVCAVSMQYLSQLQIEYKTIKVFRKVDIILWHILTSVTPDKLTIPSDKVGLSENDVDMSENDID